MSEDFRFWIEPPRCNVVKVDVLDGEPVECRNEASLHNPQHPDYLGREVPWPNAEWSPLASTARELAARLLARHGRAVRYIRTPDGRTYREVQGDER